METNVQPQQQYYLALYGWANPFSWLILLLLIFPPLMSWGQYTGMAPFSHEHGGLMINEVSNGPTGGLMEYLEFVVVGNPDAPLDPVDLSGWIIDDNNFAAPSQGNAPGHLQFGDCYTAVPPGSLIVVYNSDAPNPALPPDDPEDTNPADGVYIIPHETPCLTACLSNPTTTNPLYCPCTNQGPNPMFWPLGLRNTGDVAQVRDACETVVQAIHWSTISLTDDILNSPVHFSISNQSQSGMVIRFLNTLNDDWNNVANYDNTDNTGNETPGAPNNTANGQFVQQVALGTFNYAGRIWDCRDTDAGDLILPADAPSPTPPINLCLGEDIDAFQTDYNQPDEFQPDAVGFTFEYGFLLTANDAPNYTILDFNMSGDFDFGTLPVGSYMVWGFSYIQTNGSVDLDEFLSTVVNSVLDIQNYANCGYHGNIDNLDTQGNEVLVHISELPVASQPSDPPSNCDDGSGQFAFDLTAYDMEVLNGNTGQVSWFLDPLATLPVPDPGNFLTGPTSVYALIDNNGCLSNVVEVPISIFEGVSIDLSISQGIDCGNSATGSLQTDLLQGNAPFDFDWNENALDGQQNPNGLAAGFYEVTVTDADGCQSIASVQLDEPEALQLICAEGSPVSLFGGSDGMGSVEILGGTPLFTIAWSGPVSGTLIDVPNGLTSLPNLSAGNYSITLTDMNNCTEICSFEITEPSCGLDISINATDISCFGYADGSVVLTTSGGLPPLDIQWSNGATLPNLTSLSAGTYTVTVTDASGCFQEATGVILEPATVSLQSSFAGPRCFGENDGFIRIDSLNGGSPPFEYSLDGTFFTSISTVPFTIPNLESGSYTLLLQDVNDCILEEELFLPAPQELILELGEDEFIQLGDSVLLTGQTTTLIDSIFWTPEDPLSISNKLSTFTAPIETTTFMLEVVDMNGCRAVDEVTVFVDRRRNVYIPNAFSPNNDGENDWFAVYGGNGIASVVSFQVFDRWGELLFERRNFRPNNPLLGWDGRFRGKTMGSGVFVYLATIQFLDGQQETFKGDVTLLR